jgi:hypothetical protein
LQYVFHTVRTSKPFFHHMPRPQGSLFRRYVNRYSSAGQVRKGCCR